MESSRSPRSSPSLRLFWALPLPVELRDVLASWQRAAAVAGARWVASENLHLTLAFLGSRPAAELDAILAAGRDALSGHPPFVLRTSKLGTFPSPRSTRVLWLGLAPSPALSALAQDLRRTMAVHGCKTEPGPFVAHLTLARFKHPGPAPTLAEVPPSTFAAGEVHLFQSEPGPGGPVYRSLAALRLSS